MVVYTLKRLVLSAMVVVAVVVVLFGMLRAVPGDPATIALGTRATPEVVERYREEMHLNEPFVVQIAIYVGNVFRGDLGSDVFSNRPVTDIVLNQMGFTLALITTALAWAILVGIPLGCLAAVRPNTWLDRITAIMSVGTIAIPSFLVSIWALLVFAVMLGWLPAIGAGEPGNTLDQLYHLILPAFAVGLGWVGYL
ncbi:MAG TPA: ABC transporter permease, partial [Paracoccaceae bacterium]|nr:ABC transporter permease [Paracoccaceae bacterium]